MTDKQKLQQLFDAALKTPVANEGVAPKRAFPTPVFDSSSESGSGPMPAFQPAPATVIAQPVPVAAAPQPQAIFDNVEETPAASAEIPALDKEAAEELGKLLDERIVRKRRRRKLELVVTLILFFGSTLGGTA